jgi:hypothetical protein
VTKLRKKVQQNYPKKKVEDLVAWLETVQTLVENGKIVRQLKAWDAASVDSEDFTLKRRELFASREALLAVANYPEHINVSCKILSEFLAEGTVLVVDDVDCVEAKRKHEEWFARLTAATRNSTAMTVALTTKLAEGAKTLLGSDSTTAETLSKQWSSTDEALIAEERLLNDKTALQMVDACVKVAIDYAEELRAYLSISREAWLQMESFSQLSEHLSIFPELAVDQSFLLRLGNVTGLPFIDGAAAGEPPDGPSHMVEVHESNLRDCRRLYHKANKLFGNAVPDFVVTNGKAYARYSYEGMLGLNEFCEKYEVTGQYLNTVFASVNSAATVFEKHVGREHGRVENIYVDVAAGGRAVLGAPASLIGVRMEGGRGRDQQTLMQTLGHLALERGLDFTPQRPLFKPAVECDFCADPKCATSYICPGDGHIFCQDCIELVMNSQTRQSGGMAHLACPMPSCGGVWSDVELLKMLPGPQAEQAHKRRRLHMQMELRQEIRREVEEELASAASRAAVVPVDGELRQSLVDDALDILMDKCRGCGLAHTSNF